MEELRYRNRPSCPIHFALPDTSGCCARIVKSICPVGGPCCLVMTLELHCKDVLHYFLGTGKRWRSMDASPSNEQAWQAVICNQSGDSEMSDWMKAGPEQSQYSSFFHRHFP